MTLLWIIFIGCSLWVITKIEADTTRNAAVLEFQIEQARKKREERARLAQKPASFHCDETNRARAALATLYAQQAFEQMQTRHRH